MSNHCDTVDCILASQSPRRRELLAGTGLSFRILIPDIEEIPARGETAKAFARRAAREKAQAVAARCGRPAKGQRRLIIACDTVVAIGETILGKPRNEQEAANMLQRLSGREHAVLSGLCVLKLPARGRVVRKYRLVRTRVCFRTLDPNEIHAYASSGEPLDKAGAYAIQGGAAGMVRWIRGSYTNVVGLPLAETIEALRAFGLALPGRRRSTTLARETS